jgi:tetratricopeptide (TPR) repeat protein
MIPALLLLLAAGSLRTSEKIGDSPARREDTVFVSGALGLSPALSQEKVRAAYARAHDLFVEKKFDAALAALEQALADDPRYVPALTLRAKLAMAMARLDIARRDLTLAAELEPASPYTQFMLGFFYYLENDFKKALPALERARALDPASSRTHFYLALTHEGLADAPRAMEMYERALALAEAARQSDPDIWIAYARLLFALGEYSKCVPLIEKALAAEPTSRDAHYERGRLHFQAGEFAAAARAGERALLSASVGTTDRQIHFLLARAYARMGDSQRAAAHLAKFQASAPALGR